jgi:hypothetical protein
MTDITIDGRRSELRDARPHPATTPRRPWRERLAARLGYAVVEPPPRRQETFLDSAPELVGG